MGSLEVLGAAQLEFAAPGAKMVIGGTGLTVAGTATVKITSGEVELRAPLRCTLQLQLQRQQRRLLGKRLPLRSSPGKK